MKKRIISLALALAMCLSLSSPIFASNFPPIDTSIQDAVDAFNSLTPAQQENYLIQIETLAQTGDYSLVNFHTQYINPDYTYDETISVASMSNTVALQLQAQNLPTYVHSILLSLSSAIATGTIPLVAVVSLGVASVIANNWDIIEEKFDSIVDIFYDEYGFTVLEAFDYVNEVATFNIHVTYDLTDNSITVRGTKITCNIKAENANLSANAYYPAIRGKDGFIYVATNYQLSTTTARYIMTANSNRIGIMTLNQITALSFTLEQGNGVERGPEIDSGKENTPGYWYHYHPLIAPKCHIWFYTKAM